MELLSTLKSISVVKTICRHIFYRIRNHLKLRSYRKMHNAAKLLAFSKFIAQQGIEPQRRFSPGLPLDEEKIKRQAKWAESIDVDTIYFGDSIGDFLRAQLDSVHPMANFCRAGDTGTGFKNVMDVVYNSAEFKNVKNVVIGTFGNNALGYQAMGWTKLEIQECYTKTRLRFPDAKIIWIGFPPVYDLYANMVAPFVERFMSELDTNSEVIDMAEFSKGIMPRLLYSSDGTHLSEYGGLLFDEKIQDAKVKK